MFKIRTQKNIWIFVSEYSLLPYVLNSVIIMHKYKTKKLRNDLSYFSSTMESSIHDFTLVVFIVGLTMSLFRTLSDHWLAAWPPVPLKRTFNSVTTEQTAWSAECGDQRDIHFDLFRPLAAKSSNGMRPQPISAHAYCTCRGMIEASRVAIIRIINHSDGVSIEYRI